MYSQEKLSQIFYSGQYGFTGDRTQITKIHFLLEQKYLQLSTAEIVTTKLTI